MILLTAYLLLALVVSSLCSLMEAVLLSVPRPFVAALVEQKSVAGMRLQRMKDDVDQPLAAILTLNTFAHTLGAAGVGAEAARLWGEAWVGLVSFVVTLLVLVFSEIIPKTLGAVHAKRVAPFAAWVIQGMIIVLRPVVVVCTWIAQLLSGRKRVGPALSRDEVRGLAHMALAEGAIDHAEATLLRNLLAFREVTVEEIMTPRTVVFALPADQTVREATAGGPPRFARVPIIGTSLDDPQGVVHRRDLFQAFCKGRMEATLGELARPLHAVPSVARLPQVLKDFVHRREHLFLAVDEYGGSAGIVTFEDVVETLLGLEIVDETDTVEDMQRLARQLLQKLRASAE
ncbi:MAG: CNNM domain-containing protein [Phycisphaerae bacterium]|jgi:CBS domain containing-hemolysin-like protein